MTVGTMPWSIENAPGKPWLISHFNLKIVKLLQIALFKPLWIQQEHEIALHSANPGRGEEVPETWDTRPDIEKDIKNLTIAFLHARNEDPSLEDAQPTPITCGKADLSNTSLLFQQPESGNKTSGGSRPLSAPNGSNFHVLSSLTDFISEDRSIADSGSGWLYYPDILPYYDPAESLGNSTLIPAELPILTPAECPPGRPRRRQIPAIDQESRTVKINYDGLPDTCLHNAPGLDRHTAHYRPTSRCSSLMATEPLSAETNVEIKKVVTDLKGPDQTDCVLSITSPLSSMNLESRFERILDIVEEVGFDSIDSMAAEYYSATFKGESTPHWAQSLSRTRRLQKFLATLHTSTKNWSTEETRGYYEQIVRSAESIYVLEFQRLMHTNTRDTKEQVPQGSAESILRTRIEEQFERLIQNTEYSQLFKQDKKLLQQRVSVPLTS
ncbi:hypothetical protein MMC17_002448 [Xylographa soralifera]|nr:hypothetical protein [Xylographa soralifera]